MNTSVENLNPLVGSQITLRRIAGLLGFTFPFVLVIGAFFFGEGLQRSISNYYYTGMRDTFIAVLCMVGIVLIVYRGYDLPPNPQGFWAKMPDRKIGILAGICAILIALFPTNEIVGEAGFVSVIHGIAASIFFVAIACFSLFIFTKTNSTDPAPDKLRRNLVYKVCGYIMLSCVALIIIAAFLKYALGIGFDERYHHLFWLESIAIVAFGVSWITKVEGIAVRLIRRMLFTQTNENDTDTSEEEVS